MRSTQTQRDSWEQTKAEGLSAKLQMVRNVLVENGPLASFEIAQKLNWSFHMVTGKITNLCDSGLVRDTGRTKLHQTPRFKRQVTVWEACVQAPRKRPPACPACNGTGIAFVIEDELNHLTETEWKQLEFSMTRCD